eukprot:5792686-Prymnesium_polylepis.1
MSADLVDRSLMDLLTALSAQRYDFDWVAASEGLHALLTTEGVDLEGMPPEPPAALDCERCFADLLANRGHKSGEVEAVIERVMAKRLKVLAAKRVEL